MKKRETSVQQSRQLAFKRESQRMSRRSSQKLLSMEPRVEPIFICQNYLEASANRERLTAVIGETILREMGFKIGGVIRKLDFSIYKKAVTRDNVEVDVKITEKSQVPVELLKEKQLNELNIIRMLKHRNILDYIYGIETIFKVYLVYKSPLNGTLEEFLDNNLSAKEAVAQKMTAGLICALDYLHNELSVAHRNISPWNIYLDEFFLPRLGNFELALRTPRGKMIRTCSGSRHYTAPEAQRWESHDPFAADIWSLGAVFYEMLFARPLLHDLKFQQSLSSRMSRLSEDRGAPEVVSEVRSSRVSRYTRYELVTDLAGPLPDRSTYISKNTRNAIWQMTQYLAERRPTAKYLWSQDWVRAVDDSILASGPYRKSSRLKSLRHSEPAVTLIQNQKLKK